MNISKWINEILSNEKLLRDIRTGVMLTIALSLALVYWGFLSNFAWTGVEIRKVLGLTVVFAASLFIVRIEFKSRAFAAEMEENEELKLIEKQLFDEDVDIKNDELGIEYVANFNKDGQDKANRIKTENTILKLMEKRRDYIRRGKSSRALDAEIDRLKQEPEIDTRFKPIRYTDLISKGATLKDSKDVLDRDMIYYDPVRQGNTRSIFTTFVRSLVPGSLGIGFLISEPLINIVLYYAFLLIGFAWTISTQYIITRQNTKTIYFSTRKNKLTLLQEMKKYINERLAEAKEASTLQELFNQSNKQQEDIKTSRILAYESGLYMKELYKEQEQETK
jgi:hypothetical protein